MSKRAARQRKMGRKIEERISEAKFNVILDSATLLELRHPQLVAGSSVRTHRIAGGCGHSPADVRLVFKALSQPRRSLAISDGMFFEMKAASFAHALSRELGIEVTEERVLDSVASYREKHRAEREASS